MLIENVMAEVNNYFEISGASHYGEFVIENGSITLPFLAKGQYFKVEGSIFNNGVWNYPAEMKDEKFTGTIIPLAVPKAFEDLCEEIGEFSRVSTIGPYTSESFGGYSYQKAAGSGGGGLTWQEAFRVKLRRWRKI